LGRNDAGDWLELQLDGAEPGWASSAYLNVDGDVSQLPVRLAPAVQAQETEPAVTTAADSSAAAIMTVANSTANAAADLQGTIVFQQSPGGMIYAYNLASGKLWQLANGFDPAISPDGSMVAFVRDGGETGLYLIDIDGSNERRIFERSVLSSPKWSPDGQWIVFSRNDEGVDCYQMMPNYCMLPEEAKHRFPMGIPDSIPLVTEYQHKLSVVDSNGDNFHDVAALNSARAVDWSDAGIVYQSTAGIQITADGEDAVNKEVIFDNLNPYYFDPDLQPNGGQIVFQIKGAAQTDLWVVNTDGTGKTSLTRPKTTLVDTLPSNVAAAYSPDGQHIVFLSNRSADNNAGDWHLWVMNADGSNQRQLPIDMAIDYSYGLDQVVSWGA
jgi:dipeptidyl aminopeptidase/acylaminoacyl peptidase